MNGKVAKRIRRAIYGELITPPSERQYSWSKSLVSVDFRQAYQQAKKLYKEGKWNPTTLVNK